MGNQKIKVAFTQVYIREGVSFPFSHVYQGALADTFTSSVRPSEKFLRKFGEDWTMIVIISGKRELAETEDRGPGTLRTKKMQEWTLFLPFDVIHQQREPIHAACGETIKSACSVLERIGFDVRDVCSRTEELVSALVSNTAHFHDHEKKIAQPGPTANGPAGPWLI